MTFRLLSAALGRPVATGKFLSTPDGEGLATWFPEARLGIDMDRVPALAEDRERLWAQVSAADFLSDDEKRALLGLPERVEPAHAQPAKPANVRNKS